MITSPSPAELLQTVRSVLDAHIAPTVTEPTAAAALAQAGLVLRYVEAVVDHQLAWIREEIADIHDTAAAIIGAQDDPGGHITQALRASLDAQTESLELSKACQEYQLASEVLSRCLDRGQFANKVAVGALRRRLDREAAIKAAAGLAFTSRVVSEENPS
jgi:hypothetical protein